ncbi:phospholipase D-like domain-containing protein [Sunxiuqinia elliptica]|uniref:phospholipase D n=1 Tax=Sunxiuqinia elliptica TaxID=655355 RepID=A0A4R6GM78_9BACT|nr:phospholipase D-like domain-containing protein [Sunxiuqinia elliptica]TDN96309.1 phospholipase D-like protein [Sunxiuqinia elliptica]TDO68020.1 phospholipase D-like protein [Sunxiuqinia elliptica]
MIKATFENIRKKLSSEISDSKELIQIAVAWFTSQDLLGQLIEKCEQGCKVEVIISDHVENNRLLFDKLIKSGGQVSILQTQSGKFLHDKFVIFDNKLIITGSYNWTNSAEFYNHELVIISDDKLLLQQFSFHFNKLKRIVSEFDRRILIDKGLINAESKEAEFIKLENELKQEFIETLNESNKLGAKINATNVIEYLERYGAIGGASRLINAETERLQAGLIKLCEIGRLDISFENIILKKKYQRLFDKTVLENAEKRLKELNYK